MPASPRAAADATTVPVLIWATDIPIATHPVVLANFALLFAISGLLVGALLSFIFLMTGQVANIEPMWEFTALGTAGLFSFSLLVSIVIFGNRLPMRFRLGPEAAELEMTGSRAKTAQAAARALGWMAARFGLAGAGLIAETGARQRIDWSAVARAHFHLAAAHRLSVQRLAHRADPRSATRRTTTRSPPPCTPRRRGAPAARAARAALPRLLLAHAFLALLSSMPLVRRCPIVEKDGVLPALLVLCFSARRRVAGARACAWVAMAVASRWTDGAWTASSPAFRGARAASFGGSLPRLSGARQRRSDHHRAGGGRSGLPGLALRRSPQRTHPLGTVRRPAGAQPPLVAGIDRSL